MKDEERYTGRTGDDESSRYEHERRSIERAMHAYATFLRSAERYQKSVADFRRAKDSHEMMQGLIRQLAADRASAAAGRLEVRDAVRHYVQRLRQEEQAPEVTLRMLKREINTIVLSLPEQDALRNPDAFLEDSIRWAIKAYYDAA